MYKEFALAISPLYLLRREIKKLCHTKVPYAKSLKFGFIPDTSRYAALLLADIAIGGIVVNLTGQIQNGKLAKDAFETFYKEYLSSDEFAAFLIRQLRNSLQHKFFGMTYQLTQKDSRIFRKLTKDHPIHRLRDTRSHKKIKISITPVWDESDELIPDKYRWGNRVIVYLNLGEYFRRLEKAFRKLERNVKNNSALRKRFEKNIKIEQWPPREIEP